MMFRNSGQSGGDDCPYESVDAKTCLSDQPIRLSRMLVLVKISHGFVSLSDHCRYWSYGHIVKLSKSARERVKRLPFLHALGEIGKRRKAIQTKMP